MGTPRDEEQNENKNPGEAINNLSLIFHGTALGLMGIMVLMVELLIPGMQNQYITDSLPNNEQTRRETVMKGTKIKDEGLDDNPLINRD